MREIKFRCFGKNSKEFLQDKKGYGLTLKELQNVADLDSWEISQSTGLLDKNGKEIWEGDIVKFGNSIGEIKWEDFGWVIVIKEFTSIELWQFNGNEEVIGNIYETPELLKS
jgi:uncharacterized phage protein (TIGR01671 family)